jgi:hypothetical protein
MIKIRSVNVFAATTMALIALWGESALAQVPKADCTAVITSIPYTISAPGTYCFGSNLNSYGTVSISIEVGDVIVDLNGFTLFGPHKDGVIRNSTSPYNGISTLYGSSNVTVRNGRISGFDFAINLGTDTSSGSLVEDMMIDNTANCAICIHGANNVVRNNIIRATKGDLGGSYDWAGNVFGIYLIGSATTKGSQIIGNRVMGFAPATGVTTANGVGIFASGSDVLVKDNFVEGLSKTNTIGISVSSNGGATTSNTTVVNNYLIGSGKGIVYTSAGGMYGWNITSGVTTKYTGGTALLQGTINTNY